MDASLKKELHKNWGYYECEKFVIELSLKNL